MCIDIAPPQNMGLGSVLGWVDLSSAEHKHKFAEKEHSYITWNNIANVAGYVLSPLIGVIRMIANGYLLYRDPGADEKWDEGTECYLKAQILRGFVELLGGGHILWVPDLIATLGRYCCKDD